MNPFSLSGLFLALTCLVMLFIILRSAKSFIHYVWALFNFSLVIWGAGAFFLMKETSPSIALIWLKIAHAGVIFIAVFFYHFIHLLCGLKNRKVLFSVYTQGFIFLFFLVFTNKFVDPDTVRIVFNAFYFDKAQGFVVPLFFAIWLGIIFYGHYLLLITFLKAKSFKRTQILYLLWGLLIGFSGGITNFFPAFNSKVYPIGNFTIPLYSIIVTYAIVRYKLMDIKVAMTRAGIFLLLYTPLLGIPVYLGYKYRFERQMWPLSVFSAILLASLGPLIYRKLQAKADAILLAQQKRYQKILLHAAGGMVTEHNLARLFKLIVYIIKRSVGIKYAAIFGYDRDTHSYTLRCARGLKVNPQAEISDESKMIEYFKKDSTPRTIEELAPGLKKQIKDLIGASFDLIVPAATEQKLLGFLVLGSKLNKSPYSSDDINVFRILSHQAALAIENCLFFEDFKTVQEELFQAEKLASIGGIADGVAHQIKNRLNHFSLASGELKLSIMDFMEKHPQVLADPELVDIFEYLKTLAESVSMNVKKTDGIVKGILNFARTSEKDTYFGFVPLEDMVNSALGLLMVKHEVQDVPLKMHLDGTVEIWGVKSQLNEVIYNLLDNAYEATQEKFDTLSSEEYDSFQPKITVFSREDNDHYFLRFSDNGNGIKEKNKAKMFAPFFTTKSSYKSGSGIGMYVVKRIVEENHHGKIWFESEQGQGTTFHIRLPKPTPDQVKKLEEMLSPEK